MLAYRELVARQRENNPNYDAEQAARRAQRQQRRLYDQVMNVMRNNVNVPAAVPLAPEALPNQRRRS